MTRLTTFLAMLAITGCATAQPASDPPFEPSLPSQVADAPANDASVDDLLEQLDHRGDSLKDFTADLTLVESDALTGMETTRLGNVWVQRESAEDSRIRVKFEKRVTERGNKPEQLEYVLDDGWLTDRDYQKQVEIKRQVVRPGEKIDLMKLGEGPFPLPLGQDPREVREQFDVAKVEPTSDDPDNTVHLQLTPKENGDFAEDFSVMDVWVDPQTHMPARIQTTDVDQREVKTFDLKNIQVDRGLGDADFTPQDLKDGDKWQMRTEAYGQ